jgi:hypothetical protein
MWCANEIETSLKYIYNVTIQDPLKPPATPVIRHDEEEQQAEWIKMCQKWDQIRIVFLKAGQVRLFYAFQVAHMGPPGTLMAGPGMVVHRDLYI